MALRATEYVAKETLYSILQQVENGFCLADMLFLSGSFAGLSCCGIDMVLKAARPQHQGTGYRNEGALRLA